MMTRPTKIAALVAAVMVGLWSVVAFGDSTTFPVKDGQGAILNFGATRDGSLNLYGNQAIVDGTNAANKAAVNGSGQLSVAVGNTPSVSISGTPTVTCSSGCSTASSSNTGSAVPAQATYLGANSGGNLTGLTLTANGLKVDGSAATQPVSGTVALGTGSATIGALTANQSVNVTQYGGSAVATGTGASGVGIPRVTVANDSNVLATQSGTWTVQPGNTANTTAWLVTTTPATGNGWTPFLANAQSTTVTTVKGGAGELGGYYCWNPNTAVSYVQIFDISGAVTLGTSVPKWSIGIPPGGAANLEFAQGMHFANAIKVAATTTATGSSAPTTALDCNFAFN